MPKLLRKIALVWMLVWLPFSGVMASTLPFCSLGLGGSLAPQQNASAFGGEATATPAQELPPCHLLDADAMHDDDAPPPARSSLPGEHCSLCHLAIAIALPAMPLAPQIVTGSAADTPFASQFHSWLGEPLQPPPLSSPA